MNLFLNISYCHKDLSDAPGSKELHFARKRRNVRTKTESVKNRAECKDDFFRDTRTPRIRKRKTNESYTKP